MKNKKDVGLIVQARVASERCPKKMIREFGDTSLMDLILSKLQSSIIPNDNIFASVYDKELLDICKKYPVNIFNRSKKSANSEGEAVTEIFEWWDKLPFKNIVMVNACCPFLKVSTIERFYKDYLRVPNKGMFAVYKKKNYIWDTQGALLTPLSGCLNTKKLGQVKEAAHVLYAGNLGDMGKNIWMGDLAKPGDVYLWDKIEEKECLDIVHEWQFDMCETLYKGGFR